MADISLSQLLEAGCHFGHQSRRWNPSMAPYIYTIRDHVHIFDLVKTKEGLDRARDEVKRLTREGKQILFVGTKRQAKEIVKQAAQKVGMPWVTERWLGGTLTNFDQIQSRIRKLQDLRTQREAGELKKYTKKEQLLLDRDIARLERFLGGMESLTSLPAALFVVDTHREQVAVREAVKMGVMVIGLVDTNGDPRLVDYVIPVNDDAVKSIELVVNAIASAIVAPAKRPQAIRKAPKEANESQT